jgi:large repetitive protein
LRLGTVQLRAFELLRVLRSMASLGVAFLALPMSEALAGPFSCDGNVYQVQSGQLKIFDPITSTYVNIGPVQTPYNAVGYNILDGYAYGVQGNNVIRIHSDGTIDILYNIGSTSNSADVDESNILIIKNSTTSYKRIDLATGTQATVNITGTSFAASDVVWTQNAGVEYLLGIESNGSLTRINMSTNVASQTAVPGLPTSGGFGAIWRDSANRIFTFNNTTGGIYELFGFFGASPTATQVAIGTPNGNNDGFSCRNAAFPNLAPLAFNDSFTTPFETSVAGNVLNNNGSGADRDPEGTVLTVNTTPVTGPANGSVVLNSNGTFVYTPASNFIGTDTFVYRITDASGNAATATVSIVVQPTTANLVTVKSRSSATATPGPGETVTFQIVVTNAGPGVAPTPSLTDSLPAGITYSGHTVTQGSYTPGTGVWQIGRLNNGGTATIQLSGIVNAGTSGTTITNTTTAAAGTHTDLTNTGNDLTEAVTIASAGTSIAKVQLSGPNPVTAAGQTITYRISVTNSGTLGNLTSVVVTDTLTLGAAGRTLSTGPTFASGDTDGDNRLDIGETWLYNATYVVTQTDLNSSGNFSNTASVDTTQANLSTSQPVVTTVTRTPTLSITKTPSTVGPVSLGNVISYTYNVTNTGNVTFSNVSVNDVHSGSGPFTQPGSETLLTDVAPTLDSTDASAANGIWSTLGPGDTIRFSTSYTVTQADIDAQ